MELIIFCGVQCSGKSTFYKQHFSNSHARINLDMLRTRKKEGDAFLAFIDEVRPVVIDNTNPLCEDREKYITIAKARGYRVTGYQFKIPLSVALQRGNKRKDQKEVPAFIIKNTMGKIQPLTLSEGFDQIYEVSSSGEAVAIASTQSI